MPTYRNIAFPYRGIDLDTGRVLAPGETAVVDDSVRHADLVAIGHLRIETDEVAPAPVLTPAVLS